MENASSSKCSEKAARKLIGESSKTFEEHEPMSKPLDVEVLLSNQPEHLSSLPPSKVTNCMPTPEGCQNCSTLMKENRKLKNSVKTLREASKK